MTKLKLCGLTRPCDIEAVNRIKPDYIGFVFAEKSRRYVTPEKAAELRRLLSPEIRAVGVFVDSDINDVKALLSAGVIDIAQLHGSENAEYITRLRAESGKPVIKAFRVRQADDLGNVNECPADLVLLDSGAGSGESFDWHLLSNVKRPYFLAGGLTTENAGRALRMLKPYALDVSSGVETDGLKDEAKMAAFAAAVREENRE